MSYTIDKNPINDFINGSMDIWQRGTSFVSPTTNDYTSDRIKWSFTGTGAVTISRSTDVPSKQYNYSYQVLVTTADASIGATDFYSFRSDIEGFNYKKYVGQYGTIGFWVKSGVAGTYCIGIGNNSHDRSIIGEFTINAINTWEYKTITYLFNETGGGWSYSNGIGIKIFFMLGAGSNFQASPDTWHTGTFLTTSNQVNFMATNANLLRITGISLNVGNQVYSDFNYDYSTELIRCKRYYQRVEPASGSIPHFIGYATTTAIVRISYNSETEMRSTPTITTTENTFTDITNGSTVTGTLGSFTIIAPSNNNLYFYWNDTGTPFIAFRSYSIYLGGAYIDFDAEL